ncbi:hypothetical protein [Phycisphaera mikurensis]|uniref:Peptidase S54 rhomboid domain-containing protein n=1 Tax=Phycisphaera mikurensis (strain NBRC 102666 / KCTC 22515 / FYK2301M01) TaxID=1142394 RepID=I0ICG6_PHYMF|nr:hypothetical protein [Phycisphaera mikurensis]MBB6442170.1 membrane associated rhomboid family serine protease [Phycisphaera mikurensis]BAM02954.1 hypothetical protein PSMK_07950 [Phycisphaera mikurensis NBRC 102666]
MKRPPGIQRKLAFLAIPNLTVAVIAVQAVVWVAAQLDPNVLPGLALDGAKLRAGEWWRALGFLMLPPASNPLFLFFAFYLLYLMGTALENAWGAGRYTLFWAIGWAASVAVALLVPGGYLTNAYLVGSVFLAFAFLYPDFQILLFFILPVKVKWLALLTWLSYGFVVFVGVGAGDWNGPAMVAAATLNFFLFFGPDVVRRVRGGHRQMQRKRAALAEAGEPFHACSVCGKTDLTDPEADFRYARVGEETRCFCEEHLPGP